MTSWAQLEAPLPGLEGCGEGQSERRCGVVVLVMGVMGSGKTTVGKLLAQALGWPFYDADDYHPASNREKMRRGLPLDDNDRLPWLQSLAKDVNSWLQEHQNAVLACSALKQTYRQILGQDHPDFKVVFLQGGQKVIAQRLSQRQHAFANASLLASQFEALEKPSRALKINIGNSPEEIVAKIREEIQAWVADTHSVNPIK